MAGTFDVSIAFFLEPQNLLDMKNLTLSLLLILLCGWTAGRAQPGALDPGLLDKGTLVVKRIQQANTVMIQQDGHILAAGTAMLVKDIPPVPDADFALVRFNPKGDVDQTFGEWGRVYTDFFNRNDAILATALQPDGKILAAGYAFNNGVKTFAVARYLTSGKPDMTFGFGGKLILPLYTTDSYGGNFVSQEESEVNGIAVLPNGRIMLAGTTRENFYADYDIGLMRLMPDGNPDLSFGTSGKVIADLRIYADDLVHAMVAFPNGDVVVAGGIDEPKMRDMFLTRFRSDGSQDYSFGEAGIVRTDFFNTQDLAYALILQPDGKMLAGGVVEDDIGQDFALVRYLPNGAPDPGFGTDGKVRLDLGGVDECRALALQEDGRILAVGSRQQGETTDFAIVRFEPDGAIDYSYGAADPYGPDIGVATNFLGNDMALAAAVQPDGKLVAAGLTERLTGGSHLAIARYLGGKALATIENTEDPDASFYPNPTKGSGVLDYTLNTEQYFSADLYDINGVLVQPIVPGEIRSSGKYQVDVHIQDALPSGIYMILLRQGRGMRHLRIIVE
ncbi:MAG: T9SS type A sorting domain-containing protein [Bacteroidetes bacterium]|nr:MAG: T9SS type A sorting domain-containing protein [Bacteroidota bacterium]